MPITTEEAVATSIFQRSHQCEQCINVRTHLLSSANLISSHFQVPLQSQHPPTIQSISRVAVRFVHSKGLVSSNFRSVVPTLNVYCNLNQQLFSKGPPLSLDLATRLNTRRTTSHPNRSQGSICAIVRTTRVGSWRQR